VRTASDPDAPVGDFRYVVSLRAGHPSMPAEAIQSVIGLSPAFIETAGQPFTT